MIPSLFSDKAISTSIPSTFVVELAVSVAFIGAKVGVSVSPVQPLPQDNLGPGGLQPAGTTRATDNKKTERRTDGRPVKALLRIQIENPDDFITSPPLFFDLGFISLIQRRCGRPEEKTPHQKQTR